MNRPIWMRLSSPLIELSLTNTEAGVNEQVWDLRLEGNTLTLIARADGGKIGSIVVLEREGGSVRVLPAGLQDGG